MEPFKTKYAGRLLKTHQPEMRAYLCSEIALEANEENASEIDSAYEELVELGYVEEIVAQKIMIYAGARPRSPFVLTAAGIEAQARSSSDGGQ